MVTPCLPSGMLAPFFSAIGVAVNILFEDRAVCMGALAALVASAAYFVYIVDFVGGRTRSHPLTRWMWNRFGLTGDTHPRLVSWLVWMLLTLTMAIINVRNGSPATAIMCGVYCCGNLALLIASLKCGTWKIKWYDPVCFLLGGIALILLFGEDSPRAATVLVIVADIIAGIPTFAGVVTNPEGESRIGWRIFLAGGLINVLAFARPFDPFAWGFVESAYTLYIVAATLYLTLMTTFWHSSPRR